MTSLIRFSLLKFDFKLVADKLPKKALNGKKPLAKMKKSSENLEI